MKQKHFLVGKRIGILSVLQKEEKRGRRNYYKCLCDCGNTTIKMSESLTSGRVKSCGCIYKATRVTCNVKHLGAHTREYSIWSGIKMRCNNIDCVNYPSYGGRGIDICNQWDVSFETFINDMGVSPSKKHSIDRIDNSKGYYPENCRWATTKDQVRNTRKNVWIEWEGKIMILKDWASFFKTDYSSFRRSVKLNGSEKAFIKYNIKLDSIQHNSLDE